MAQQLINGKQQFIDGNGAPLAGGSVAFYSPGTLNPVNTWQDSGLTVLNANPVTLDANGMASIWALGGQQYRQIVKDVLGNTIWDQTVGLIDSYQYPASGSVSRTVAAKLQESVSVLDFGADPTGAADSTAAIQAAVAALGAPGGVVYFPPGTYKAGGITLASYNNIRFVGAHQGNTATGAVRIVPNSATTTVFSVQNLSGVWFEKIAFVATTQMTAGSFVSFTGCNDCGITDYYMQGGFDPVVINGVGTGFWMQRGQIRNFNGYGVTVEGGAGDIYIDALIMDQDNNTYTPQAGIYTPACGGSLNITNSDILHCHYGFWANPGAGQFVDWVYMSNVYFDSADFATGGTGGGNGIRVTPHGGGIFNGGSLVNMWTSTATVGIYAVGDASSQLSGFQLTNWIALNNWQQGGYFDYCDHVSMANIVVAGNGKETANAYPGIYFGPHNGYDVPGSVAVTASYTLTGGAIGSPLEGYTNTQNYAIEMASGFSGYINVSDVDMSGNATGSVLDSGATPAIGSKISGCRGYNPVGTSLVTVGASPFSYTAGLSPESVNLYGGAGVVSTVGGVALANTVPASFVLQPLQTVSISYTSVPTMAVNKA